jgi:putative MATE family efflux protein
MNKSAKMGTMPIPKLLTVMSLPAIFSMLIQALYNVVDTIFVAKISGAATTALSLAFPLQMLVIAFAIGVGVGSNSAISRRLGEEKQAEAEQTAKHGLFLAIVISIFFAAFGYLISKVFISSYVSKGDYTDASTVLTYGIQYLAIVTSLSFGMHLEIFGSKALQATGNMIAPMTSQIIGAVVNIILDPILIFGLLGFPRLEVVGAAIATIIGQFCAMLFTFFMIYKTRNNFTISLKGIKLQKHYFNDILKVGIPVTILNSVSSFTIACMNLILNSKNT